MSGIQFDDEQYQQKLKHSYNFDKTKIKKQIFINKNNIFGLHMQEATFKVNTLKEVAKICIKMIFAIWQL